MTHNLPVADFLYSAIFLTMIICTVILFITDYYTLLSISTEKMNLTILPIHNH